MQADHIQPHTRRRYRPAGDAHAARAEIHEADEEVPPHQGKQHKEPHKHTRQTGGSRREKIRRLGDGHHRRFIRTCYPHAYGTLNELHTYGKAAARKESQTRGKGRHQATIAIQEHCQDNYNGCEFAEHEAISRALSMKGKTQNIVFFADSYCSWQKGAVENANKLIRRYIKESELQRLH